MTLTAFCALATKKAREKDASFPALRPSGLVLVETWYADTVHESDQRSGGRGWLLRVELRHLGPGDTVEQEEWTAIAEGLGVPLEVSCVDGAVR